MLPSETCLRLPRGLPRVEFPCGGCPFPPTGFTSRLRKPCKEGTHRKTDTNEAVNSANVTNCRAPIGFPPCKTTPCFPSTYNWPHGACKTKMKQGGPENSQATRRTARRFNKVLRYGQLCSARNGRKIFTETSFALMVSGATTHHSMLCQLCPLAAWGLQNQNEIHLYRVVFLVFLLCGSMVSRFHWVDWCHPFKNTGAPSSGGLRSWNFSVYLQPQLLEHVLS